MCTATAGYSLLSLLATKPWKPHEILPYPPLLAMAAKYLKEQNRNGYLIGPKQLGLPSVCWLLPVSWRFTNIWPLEQS